VEIKEVLRHWQAGGSQWAIARATGLSRTTVRIQELLAQRGCPVLYTSLRRFVRRRNWQRKSQPTVCMADTRPREVAELDLAVWDWCGTRTPGDGEWPGPWSSCCPTPGIPLSGPYSVSNWPMSSKGWDRWILWLLQQGASPSGPGLQNSS
jgi:hypothetical protein